MAYKKMLILERNHGDLHKLIPSLVNQHGQHRTAKFLGVSTTTINTWLKSNGYRKQIIYQRDKNLAASQKGAEQ